MLLYSIYVNNIQLCTPFPNISRLEAATMCKSRNKSKNDGHNNRNNDGNDDDYDNNNNNNNNNKIS